MKYSQVFEEVYDMWPNKIYIADVQKVSNNTYLFKYLNEQRD